MKKTIKRILSVVLCAGLMLSLFAGCSETDNHGLKKNDPVSVTIWNYYNGAQLQAFEALVSQFNDTVGKEQGIIVESRSQGNNVSELIQKAMDSLDGKVGAEQFPDMLAAYADTAYEINNRGMAADISQYLSQEEMDAYVTSYMDEGRFTEKGGVQLFPIAKSTEIFMLNETDWLPFAEATGASEESFQTWEGVTEVAKQYYEYTDGLTPDVANDGKAFFGRDAMANYLLIGSMQLGTEIFSVKDGEVTYQLDETAMRRLWDNYYIPYINGWFKAVGKFRSDDTKTGEIISFVGSTSGSMYFPTEVTQEDGSVYPVEAKVFPLPNFEGTEPYAVQQGAGILVTKSEEKKEYASTVFLKWFTQADNNMEFCLGSGYLPVLKEANDEKKVEEQLLDKGESKDSALFQTLTVGVNMVQDYSLYTNKAFKNGTDARNLLENAFTVKSQEDRAAVEELIAGGMEHEEAVAQFDTDENFKAWYEGLKASFEELNS